MTRTLNTLWSVGHYLSWRDLRFRLVEPPDRARLICVYGLAGPTWPEFQIQAGHILDGVGREPEFIVDQWQRIDWWTHPRSVLDGASVADAVRGGADFDEIVALVGERG